MKMYFLSDKNMNNKILYPRVPSNYFTQNGYEDKTTKRVCFAPSIDKALMGLSQNCTGKIFYVHIPTEQKLNITHPTIKQVPDSKVTGEIWSLNATKIQCIGSIKVIGDKGLPGHKFKYGDDNEAELYDWDWKWVDKYIEEDTDMTIFINEGFLSNIQKFINIGISKDFKLIVNKLKNIKSFGKRSNDKLSNTTYNKTPPKAKKYVVKSTLDLYTERFDKGELQEQLKNMRLVEITDDDTVYKDAALYFCKKFSEYCKENKKSDIRYGINHITDPYDKRKYLVLWIDDDFSTLMTSILCKGVSGNDKYCTYIVPFWNREGTSENIIESKTVNHPQYKKPVQEGVILQECVEIFNEASKPPRKYKCPYCDIRLPKVKLVEHIEDKHEEMIPQDFTAARVVFNMINHKECGHCVQCGKVTKWNDKTWRYERYCSQKCIDAYTKMAKERMIKTYGKAYILDDPKHQEKMLQGRSISGTYKFKDGGVRNYCGSYEKKLLEFFDLYLECKSQDIQTPGPTVHYKYNGEDHFWITDLYYTPANLVFDVKDGGDNPNTREMPEYRAKQSAKEAAIIEQKEYNYIRLTNNNFEQLLSVLADIRMSMMDNDTDKVIHINEFMSIGAINPVIDARNDAFIVPCMVNNSLADIMYSKDSSYLNLYKVRDGKIVKANKKELKDNYDSYNLFKYKGDNIKAVLGKINEAYTSGSKVNHMYFYEVFTDKELLSDDQIYFDESFALTMDDYKSGELKLEITKESFDHQYRKAIGENVYFPIIDPQKKAIKEYVLKDYPNYDILQDINGYFIYDKIHENRTISYNELNNIDISIINIMDNLYNK